MNKEAEKRAAEIRIRAERKTGQLLGDAPKAKGTRGQLAGSRVERPPVEEKTISNLGISKDQSLKWQRVSRVLKERFEIYSNKPGIPSHVEPDRSGQGFEVES